MGKSHWIPVEWVFPLETKAWRKGFLQQKKYFCLWNSENIQQNFANHRLITLFHSVYLNYVAISFAIHAQLLNFTYISTVIHFHSEACHSARLLELTVRLEHYLQMCALLSLVIICKHGLKLEANIQKLSSRHRLKTVTQVALDLFA